MDSRQINRLRSSGLGEKVKMGYMTYEAITFNRHFNGSPCAQCCFGVGHKRAESCGVSQACMAHLREDGQSVIFVRNMFGNNPGSL